MTSSDNPHNQFTLVMNPSATQMPPPYSYANRRPSYYRKMTNELVTLVMTNVFSTVWAMHAHDEARKSGLQAKADQSRVILGREVLPNDLQDCFSPPHPSADAKHHGTCRCVDCLAKKKESQLSQEERYLIEQGMAPDSQEANAAMDKLLGKRTRPRRGTARSPRINQPHTPTITSNVPETPFTLPTEQSTVNHQSARQFHIHTNIHPVKKLSLKTKQAEMNLYRLWNSLTSTRRGCTWKAPPLPRILNQMPQSEPESRQLL